MFGFYWHTLYKAGQQQQLTTAKLEKNKVKTEAQTN